MPISDEDLRVVDRPADQAAAVLDEISRIADTVGVGDVVVGVTDEGLIPYVEEWLGAGGLPVHYAGGRPAATLPPYRLLGAVADYLEARSWESFAALVRHPDVEVWIGAQQVGDAARDPAAAADRYHQAHLPAVIRGTLPGGMAAPGGQEGARALRDLLERRLLAGLRGKASLAKWPERLLAIVSDVYSLKRVPRDERAAARFLGSLEKVRDAALRLHLLPEAVSEPCDAATALRLLLDELGEAALPEEPERDSVEVLGWLEVPLDDAPVAIVAGVNEPRLPESVSAHPFLPDRLRSLLGLTDNATRYARDAYHLTAMLHAGRLRCIAGRFTATGDPLRPSRLLLAARGEALARRIRIFTDGESGSALPATPLLAMAGGASAFALPPERRLEVEPPRELPVTAFRALLEDPYRYVLERHLGLRSVHDEAREMDGSLFGDVAHEVLRRLGRMPVIHSDRAAEITAALDDLLDAEARRRFAGTGIPTVRLQLELLRLRLHAFARWQASRAAEGWEVVWVEGAAAGGGAGEATDAADATALGTLDVDGEPIGLRGRIDRVDRNGVSGEWVVLDYKTGDAGESPEEAHRRRSGEWKDLQLPLYRHLARAISGPGGGSLVPPDAELRLGYILLCPDLERVGVQLAAWDPDDLRSADETAREVVRGLRRGWVEFDPTRIRARPGDPFAPLLGRRQLVGAIDDELDTEGTP